jgi:hypothetical protein
VAQETQRWYPATEPGLVEIKDIPAARLMVASGDAGTRGEGLFGRLFRYIDRHDVKMTVPVEAGLGGGEMRFYVGSRDLPRALRDDGGVRLVDAPARTVASIGARGSYSWQNIRAAQDELEKWLANHGEYRAVEESYVVFWNGPYVPGMLKHFEVHVPVRRVLN